MSTDADAIRNQEQSDLEAERIQDSHRRAGTDVPESPKQVAFVWVDLIREIAVDQGLSSAHLIMARLASIIGETPGLKARFQQQNQEMSNAIERRSALRDHRR